MKNKEKNYGHFLFNMIPVIAIIGMIVFGALFLKDYIEYKSAEDEYEVLADTFIRDTDSSEEKEYSDKSSQETASDDIAADDPMYYPVLQIDYDSLEKTNNDFACVICIPALELKYPVVYSADNNEYLHKTFEGRKNSAGSIFYDSLSPRDFTGMNTYIFGHNMKDGSMFGSLKRLEREEGLCSSDPYIYIYTKDCIRKYRIFSFYETSEGSKTYDDFDGDDGYDQYVKMALSNSNYKDSEEKNDFTKRPQLLTLSTCTGQSGSGRRYVIHAYLYVTVNNPNKQ